MRLKSTPIHTIEILNTLFRTFVIFMQIFHILKFYGSLILWFGIGECCRDGTIRPFIIERSQSTSKGRYEFILHLSNGKYVTVIPPPDCPDYLDIIDLKVFSNYEETFQWLLSETVLLLSI